MKCGDVKLILCMACIFWPGVFGGMDHRMPGSPILCAHQHRDPDQRTYQAPSGWAGSYRYLLGTPGNKGPVFHWATGICWCNKSHTHISAEVLLDPFYPMGVQQ